MRRAVVLVALAGCGGSAPARREVVAVQPAAPPAPQIEVIAEGVRLDRLATDGAYLYWENARGVVRRPLDGGDAEPYAGSVTWDAPVEDTRGVYRASEGGIELEPRDGSDAVKVVDGFPVWALAVDDLGLVYSTAGAVLERRGDDVLVELVPDEQWSAPGVLVLARGALYVTARRGDDREPVVLRVPRVSVAEVAYATSGEVRQLVADDGRVCWLEDTDATGTRVMCDGEPAARMPDAAYGIALDGRRVYVHDEAAIYQARELDLRELAPTGWVSGLTAHNGYLYWFDERELYVRAEGGEPVRFADDMNDGGRPDLAFDDDHVYVRGIREGDLALFRIDRRGHGTRLWSGGWFGSGLVVLEGHAYFPAATHGRGAIFDVTTGGDAAVLRAFDEDTWFADLVESGGVLFALVQPLAELAEPLELLRIDPATGETTSLLRWRLGTFAHLAFAADDRALYLALDDLGVILRIPTT